MLRELWSATRRLSRESVFTLAAAGTLALGISSATALFSVLHAVLLEPLPIPRPGDVYTVRTTITDGRFTSGLVAPAELVGLQQASEAVLAAAASRRVDATLVSDGQPYQVAAHGVSEGFFDLFGLPMALGRSFVADEHLPKAAGVVVLSHGFWRRVYGSDPGVIGKMTRLSSRPVTVIGVADPELDVPRGADLWFNISLSPADISHLYEGYLRLKPGTTPQHLREPMAGVMQELARLHPDQNKNRVYVVRPLLDSVVGDLGPTLVIVFGSTVLLLVLAAINVTNLLLARGTARARELAVRAALGASHARLIHHIVAESLVLAGVGGLTGVIGAYLGVRALLWAGASQLPRLERVTLEPTVLAFAAVTILGTGLVVGLLPAFRLARTDLRSLIDQQGRGVSSGRVTQRVLGAMVAIEIAAAIALVTTAGRLLTSFENLRGAEAGFTVDERLIVDLMAPNLWSEPARMATWIDDVRARIESLGGLATGAASSVPLGHEWDSTTFVDIVSQPITDPHQRPNGRLRRVTPGFFEVLGVRTVAGRSFTVDDRHDGRGVVIVNQAFARRFFGTEDPVGQRVVIPGVRAQRHDGRIESEHLSIVGVVGDVRYASLGVAAEPTVYLPQAQAPAQRLSVIVHVTDGSAQSLIAPIRDILTAMDSEVPVGFRRLSDVVATSISRQRLGMMLMSTFGIAALALAAIGVFGVIAYAVAERRGEMAVRLALGCTSPRVFWLVVGYGVRLAAIGVPIGLAMAWATGQFIAGYVYNVQAGDPLVLGVGAAVVVAAAVGATLVPAWRAAAIEPAAELHAS